VQVIVQPSFGFLMVVILLPIGRKLKTLRHGRFANLIGKATHPAKLEIVFIVA
jgi:hypothetical protein